ncbi:ABC transporter ATP-binding protein [Pseudoalteromonas sp. HF66]|uniref:ABC transporter ATP-binding protein n=1 Tax=Pseudoalteromonas sp. HF66 TaxID=2721559 RepID=UPI00142FB48C|nr:ABC transporter ATP-binding protein [Pseudoalteromonas sp. HF66]NIZ06426.1 ABC transporter ATP-binding protein [Pseudoalteromonas sp. HF66]
MIVIKGAYKKFIAGEIETSALSDISITINKGEFISVLGSSGSGKSTLLNVLGMLDTLSSGSYFFDGECVSTFSDKKLAQFRREKLGFIFQSFNLIDDLTVFENIELPLKYNSVPKDERTKLVNSALIRMDISHRANHYPHQLSGGQQQRVAIARACITNPKIIFADEPTGNLDSVNSREVMEVLKELNNEGATIVMVTHSEKHAKSTSRVIRINDGKLVSSNYMVDQAI